MLCTVAPPTAPGRLIPAHCFVPVYALSKMCHTVQWKQVAVQMAVKG